jgi:hypothetical protein
MSEIDCANLFVGCALLDVGCALLDIGLAVFDVGLAISVGGDAAGPCTDLRRSSASDACRSRRSTATLTTAPLARSAPQSTRFEFRQTLLSSQPKLIRSRLCVGSLPFVCWRARGCAEDGRLSEPHNRKRRTFLQQYYVASVLAQINRSLKDFHFIRVRGVSNV